MSRRILRWRLGMVFAAIGIIAGVIWPHGAQAAELTALKATPLKYQEHIPLGGDKIGYMDISNPTMQALTVKMQAQAFRQVDAQGNLQFYDDDRISAGIIPEFYEFTLGPHEAIRLKFTIRTNTLGAGGTYGVLFAQTSVPGQASGGASVAVAARVGTLFILDIGDGGTRSGYLAFLHRFGAAFGDGVSANLSYTNVGESGRALAFSPKLAVKTGWFGKSEVREGPFTMPHNARPASFFKKGNYIGIIPITVSDQTGGAKPVKQWLIVCTGYWRYVVGILILSGLGWLAYSIYRRKQGHLSS